MKNLIITIKSLFLSPILLFYISILQSETIIMIKGDFRAWCQWKSRKYSWFQFLNLFSEYPEFRSIIYRRIGISKFFISWLFKGQQLLFITKNPIDTGLLIQHGFSTTINSKSMGANCKIYQQVTIGYNGEKAPSLGNNVTVCCGAKVIGGVTIGDDVIIGANAVVVKDIPNHCIVVGVPAKIIKRRNSINDDWQKV